MISLFSTAGAKKSVAALPNEEKAESPTQLAPKDPDEKLILDSYDNGVKALQSIVSRKCGVITSFESC